MEDGMYKIYNFGMMSSVACLFSVLNFRFYQKSY